MNINFAPIDEQYIRSAVEDGYYTNATELVRDAVRRLRQTNGEKRTRLMAALEKGMEDVRAGRVVPYTPELLEQIWQEGMQDAANGVKPDPDVCP